MCPPCADHPILEFLRPYADTPNLDEKLTQTGRNDSLTSGRNDSGNEGEMTHVMAGETTRGRSDSGWNDSGRTGKLAKRPVTVCTILYWRDLHQQKHWRLFLFRLENLCASYCERKRGWLFWFCRQPFFLSVWKAIESQLKNQIPSGSLIDCINLVNLTIISRYTGFILNLL